MDGSYALRALTAVQSSLARIDRCRRHIRASRVLTRSIRGGDGSGPAVSPIGLRQRIRSMIETGVLPCLIDRRSWVGQGHGQMCRLCQERITQAHWEHEVEILGFGEIRSHGVCFRIWADESTRLRKIA